MVLQIWDTGLLIEPAPAPKPLADHPDCCCGEGICDRCTYASKPDPWIMDVGAGGWVDELCDHCDQVSGEYTLDEWFPSVCIWRYTLDPACTSPGASYYFQVSLSHFPVGVGASWKWQGYIEIRDSWYGSIFSEAYYDSAESTDSDCWDLGGNGVGNKITLNKASETHQLGVCSSTLPATVDVWAP